MQGTWEHWVGVYLYSLAWRQRVAIVVYSLAAYVERRTTKVCNFSLGCARARQEGVAGSRWGIFRSGWSPKGCRRHLEAVRRIHAPPPPSLQTRGSRVEDVGAFFLFLVLFCFSFFSFTRTVWCVSRRHGCVMHGMRAMGGGIFEVFAVWFGFGFGFCCYCFALGLNVSTGVWESENASFVSIRFTFRTMGRGRIRRRRGV